jgi:hypothetical protein
MSLFNLPSVGEHGHYLMSRLDFPHQSGDQQNGKDGNKYIEHHFRDTCGRDRNSAESENPRRECDDKKN